MARVTIKTLGEISSVDRSRLLELTNPDVEIGSSMVDDVLDRERNLHAFHCFIAREEDWIVGWASVFEAHRSVTHHRAISSPWRGDHFMNVYIYVDPDQRGCGVGKHIMRRVVSWLRKHRARGAVYPWTGESTTFFNSCIRDIPNASDTLDVR